jgi:hypothetical protein
LILAADRPAQQVDLDLAGDLGGCPRRQRQ